MRIRVLGLVAAIVTVIAACGDLQPLFPPRQSAEGETSTVPPDVTTTTTESSSTRPDSTGFPEEVVDAYLEGCSLDADPRFCRCTIEEFGRRMTLEEFLALDFTDAGRQPPVVEEVAEVCLDAVGTTTTTSTTAPPRSIDELVDSTVTDLEAFWAEGLRGAYGLEYLPIAGTIPYYPSTGDVPDCGTESLPPHLAEGNAFYCEPDDFIAWDAETLLPDLYTEFGDFAVSLVLAHEWGHAVQTRGRVLGPTIMTELQADCFAGAWTAAVAEGGRLLRLAPGDLEEAMAGYLLFRDPVGTPADDPEAHGSAFDRVAAFQDGFFTGVAVCVEYEAGTYTVVDIPLTTLDLQTGGDLAFDEVEPLLTAALEAYWEVAFPELFGSPWIPVSGFGPYLPSSGDLPSCGTGAPEEYENSAFYCADGDFVAWDGEVLIPDLYQAIGDFAVGMVLGHEWGIAVQAKAGLPIEGVAAELRADCFAGAWSAAMVPFENPTEIVLSAGDLDEAVAGFLGLSDDPGDAAQSGTAFQRFDAFREGFFGGAAACLG